jgi:uncharacterized iron-regulated membrane protein
MSVAHTTPAPVASDRRTSLARWIGGGTLAATALTVLTIAVWPASEVDKARADGEQFGQAVVQLQDAQSTAEVDAALAEVQVAASDTADHAGDAVTEQVDDQADALDRAADGFVGSLTADDEFEQDLYQAELDIAVDDLTGQAEEFRTTGPEVQQAFWDGYQDGLAGS